MAVHQRRYRLSRLVRMVEAEDVTELVQRHAVKIENRRAPGRETQSPAIRVPAQMIVEQNIRLGRRSTGCIGKRDGEDARPPRGAVNVRAKKDIIDAIAAGARREGI